MPTAVLIQLAVATGLGVLVGLQRERTQRALGGIRTFPLIALFGAIAAHLGQAFGGWVVAAGLLALAACLFAGNMAIIRTGGADAGMTTEVGALLLYALGAYVVVGDLATAVVVGGVVVLLLQLKQPMHAFAGAVGDADMRAITQFVLLSLVILPVLPRGDFGPYRVWNPFAIWLMVTLIVGISLSGYVAYKVFGTRAGPLLAGLLGGLISSTATTASYARRAAGDSDHAPQAAFVIAVASAAAMARVLVEIAVVAPREAVDIVPPVAVLFAVSVAAAVLLYRALPDDPAAMPEQRNPADLGSALAFGAVYAVVLLAVAAARDHFGDAGLFAVALFSGLTDLDAITLSSAGLAEAGRADADLVWRAIVVAALANLAFKLGLVAMLGHRTLARRVGVAFAGVFACGAALLGLWPY